MALATSLAGRVAAITGASSGMGEATARRLAKRRAAVALIARRTDRLETIASQIEKADGRAIAAPGDVTQPDTLAAGRHRDQEPSRHHQLVFNNAGIMLPAPMVDKHTAEWDQQIRLNTAGAVNTIGAFIDQLF